MKKIRVTSVLVILLITVLAISVMPVIAEDKGPITMEMVRDKIRADKKMFVAVNMQLPEADAKAFWPVYEAYQKELQKRQENLEQKELDCAVQNTCSLKKTELYLFAR